MMDDFKIAGRAIGSGNPPYIIAELSGNHNGSLDRALDLLEAASVAGADAVKLQTYRPDTITIDHDAPEFIVNGGLWHGRRLYDLYQEAHTPWEWHKTLFEKAKSLSITLFSAPFDPTAVDLLEELGTPAYKIASPELIDIPLIQKVASCQKPMILSTGMASFEEIEAAIVAARSAGAKDIAVLHCTSAYPTPPEEANLATLRDLKERLGVVVGLSDHTLATTVAVAAVAMGADIVEKHFCLSRADGGIDSAFSLEPEELTRLVDEAKIAHMAIGSPQYRPTKTEATALLHRRSLYVVKDVKAGEILTPKHVRSIRPALGLSPKYLTDIMGKKTIRKLSYGEPFSFDMIE